MTKKTQVEILVHTPFIFTTEGGEKTSFATGRHSVDKDVAEHWFVVAHSDQTGSTETTVDDSELQAQISSLTTQLTDREKDIGALNQSLVDKDGEIATLKQSVTDKDAEISSLTTQLAALQAGGKSDGKK